MSQIVPDIPFQTMKRNLSKVAQSGLNRPILRLSEGFMASSVYMAYMTILLVDKFKILFALTALMFLAFKFRKRIFSRQVTLLQVVFLGIAARCYWLEIIPESKFFIIYILALYSGVVLAPIIAKQSTLRFFLYITFVAVFVRILEYFDIHLISLEIDKNILLPNYAEILTFHLLAVGYLRGRLNKPLLLMSALFSGSKFLTISSILMSFSRRFYLLFSALMVIALFIFNPYGYLDSRISLYAIFYKNFNIDIFLLNDLRSVNDILTIEHTIYSFHNIWMDYLWYGGVIGIVPIFVHSSIIYRAFYIERGGLEKSVILMYFLCITFGFSVFFGTKYMMLMLGVILFKQDMEDLRSRSAVIASQ